MKKLGTLVLTMALSLASMAQTARAEGFALYEYSARGVALGGAVMARKPDASAVAYNPALLTRLPGKHIQAGLSAIMPDGKMDSVDSNGNKDTTSVKSSVWPIPHLYYTHQLTDNLVFGIGEFSRFGLGFEYPHNWPGRENIYEVTLTSASINPNIAWAATDKLSLAAGVELVYVNLDLKKRAVIDTGAVTGGAIPGSMEVDSNITNAEDVGVGFNVAGHYQFSDQWAAGLQYRSQVRVHAKGDVEFSNLGYTGTHPAGGAVSNGIFDQGFKDGKAHSTVILPDSIAGGVSWTPVPEFSVEAGAIWTRWSTFRDLNIHLPSPRQATNDHKHWKDAWRFNVGAEYEPVDWLALRAGYVFDQSPMTAQYEDYLVPTNGRSIYSAGFGVKWEDWTADFAYAYIDAKGRTYSQSDDTHVLQSKAKNTSTQIVSFSLGYAF